MGAEGGPGQLRVHPAGPVAVLRHDSGGRRACQQPAALARAPFNPKPTPAPTRTTGTACPPAVRRATCRSRPAFWPSPGTRAHSPAPPRGDETVAVLGDTGLGRPTFRAGTGSLPFRYQRYTVVTWMPCACAQSVKFTSQEYYLELMFAL